jgi:thiamine biosynthesis protein ThiC
MIEYLRGLVRFLDGLDQFEREVVAGVFDEGDHLFVGGPLDIDIADSYDYITFSHSGQLKIN